MRTDLQNISTIRTGVFEKQSPNSDVVYLQAKDFDENGSLISEPFPELSSKNINYQHFLNSGDVLFAAKGTKNFATVFKSNGIKTVASTTFFVIRLYPGQILPEFLAWFINLPYSQRYFKQNSFGTAIKSVPKSVLATLMIPHHDIDMQEKFMAISELNKKQQNIESKLSMLKYQRVEELLIKKLNFQL